ncbi:hypothetical protein FC89_GL001243 [Liquorilactobacillus ghanensis DSM 18630]|uniref:Uncharacterized protein n=1 Tax=Liquorilactobacillus ghanensis DSM 18630 TaxID=1423750 RepID=A0A0R1VJY6_9LACO|nr:hypothetical protein FC89_GL001243 [Liquorilactobacillus ghanensis DSM 18630]
MSEGNLYNPLKNDWTQVGLQGCEKMEKIVNPTKARTNLFSLIKNDNRDSTPVIIAGADDRQCL